MRKITLQQQVLLKLIDRTGGSYCPPDDIAPEGVRLLDDLVKAKRLAVEPTDGGPRYHLTAQGREDAANA
jgi:hypothetical protein